RRGETRRAQGGPARRRRARRARARRGRACPGRAGRGGRDAGAGARRPHRRRARRPRRPRAAAPPRRAGRRRHRRRVRLRLATVARRRLPLLHRPRLQDRGPGRVTAARHTWFMVVRQARNLAREPIWIVMMIIQPMVWLLLYGQLFKNVTRLGGFGTQSYITFLAPAIVVMNAFFGATWSGMS